MFTLIWYEGVVFFFSTQNLKTKGPSEGKHFVRVRDCEFAKGVRVV